jgi:WD40 repeat protein
VVALSPDGRYLAYVGQAASGTMLYLRALRHPDVKPVVGSEGAIFAFFSPDSRWLGFLANDRVKTVAVDGGVPTSVTEARVPVRATWTPENVIFFDEDQGFSVSNVPAAGGVSTPVKLPGGVISATQVLPGNNVLMSTLHGGLNKDYGDLVLVSSDGVGTVVQRSGYDGRYEGGHLLFGRAGSLLAVPFDVVERRTMGEPRVVAAGVSMDSIFGVVHAAVAEGAIAYVPGGNRSLGRLAWVDRQGAVEYLPVPARVYGVLDLAPSGDRLAVHVGDVSDYVWVYDIVRREGRRLAAGEGTGWPIWNRDGPTITHTSRRSSDAVSVVVQSADGAGDTRRLVSDVATDNVIAESWSPDGRFLALALVGRGLRRALLSADGRLERIDSRVDQYGNSFSPDGRWLAFGSTDTGQFEIYVESFPDRKAVRQISTDGGLEPRWCPCGELFYRNGNRWMSVKIRTEPELQWDPPQLAFQTDFIDTPGRSYDVSPDGKRLLVVKRAEPDERRRIHLVTNWGAELEASPSSR